jgi:diguanylate cyclase (GGDEF)-like protein/PAS domain S-box-containing protein
VITLGNESAQSMLDNAPCGLLITDTDDVVVRVNDTFLQWTGYTREQVKGRLFHDLLDAAGQVFYDTRYRDELWTHGELREIVVQLVGADGSSMPIMLNSRMVIEDGVAAGVRLAVFDIRNRQDFEREMLIARKQAEASETSVRILQRAADRFVTATTEGELIDLVAAVAQDAFAASEVAIMRYEPEGGYEIVRGGHLRSLIAAARASRPQGDRGMSADEVFLISDIEQAYELSEELGDLFRQARGAAFSGVSISDDKSVIGSFGCLYGRPRTFDTATVELHRALAKQMGLAFSRVRLQERLTDLASRDQVTGVASRAYIDSHAAASFHEATETRSTLAHLFLDLDGFKLVNDQLGHRTGDLVLKTVADRIRAAVRDDDVVGRFGGDEFLIVCKGTDAAEATAIARRIASDVAVPMEGIPAGMGVTASIGVAIFDPSCGTDANAEYLTRRADAAMYESKRVKGNRVTLAN